MQEWLTCNIPRYGDRKLLDMKEEASPVATGASNQGTTVSYHKFFTSNLVKWASLWASSSSLNKVVSHRVVPVLHKTARNLQIFLYSKYYHTLTINSKTTRVKYWNVLLYLTYSNCLVQHCLCISCIIWTRQHGMTEVGLQQEVCFCVWTVKRMGIDFNRKMFCQFTVHLIFIVSHRQICVLISIL